jgi:uncharacterized protein with beta-barrel porin domain
VPDRKIYGVNMGFCTLRTLSAKVGKSAAMIALIIPWPQFTLAETTTIDAPVTGTQGPSSPPLNGGDTLTITTTGSITVTSDNATGASATNGGNTVNNYGTIRTTGSVGIGGSNTTGISTTGGSSTINNYGAIITTGNGRRNPGRNADGINAADGSNTIINSGTITTSGSPNARGILAGGGNNFVANHGTITTAGSAAINAQLDGNTLINSGIVRTTGVGDAGIRAIGSSNAVINRGSITTTGGADGIDGSPGIDAGRASTITNDGSINTSGDYAYGIYTSGGSSFISNSASIRTTGSIVADGINAEGNSNIVINSGTVSTTGDTSYGVFANGNLNSISNSGTISTHGRSGVGIGAGSSNGSTLANAGRIITSGSYADGMSVEEDSNGNIINNSGSISTTGEWSNGIYAEGSFNAIINSGAISASGKDAGGIVATGDSNTATNSGDIDSKNGYAVSFYGSGNNLIIAGGSIEGLINMGSAGTINLANGTTITLGGIISGTNGLTINSSGPGGTIILSAVNTYVGPTTVANGASLSVNGSIASSSGLTVQSGGTVGGTGSLPQINLVSGAKIAPGNSIGTMTVSGLNLNGGSIDAEIQGPQRDEINVTGQVTNFTGTTNLIPYGGGNPWPGFTYTIVNAPSSADFATSSSLTLDQTGVTSALLRAGTNLIQNADGNQKTFDVQWRPKNGIGATASAMQALGQGGANQLATAGAFDRVFQSLATNTANNTNNTGSLIGSTGFTTGQAAAAGISTNFLSVTSQLLGLGSSSQLTTAINSLSPEPYAAFQSVGLDTLKRQRELLMSQGGNCRNKGWVVNATNSKKGKQPKQPLCVFAQAANATSSINGQDGLSSYSSGIFSTYYGVEYKPAERWTIGAAYGYGTSYLNNMALTSAVISSGVNSGSLYGVYKPSEPWTIRGLLGYSNFNATGSRNVAYIGNGSAITGNPTANGYTAAINADYLIQLTKPTAKTPAYLKPLLGIAWGGYQQGSFSEANGDGLNLNVNSNTANSLLGTVGLELATAPIALNRSKTTAITPRLAIAYQVDALGNDSGVKSLNSSFAQAPAAGSFTTQGENRGVNAFSIDGGIDLQVASNASVYANVGYEAFSTGSQFTYGGGFKVKF